MKTIKILSPNDYLTFSGGEVHVKLDAADDYRSTHIICTDYSMNGFMAVCQANQIARARGATWVGLTYPYLPYARQDRFSAVGQPFSLKLFCDMINAQHFDMVRVYDPHSDVATALLDRVESVEQYTLFPKTLFASPIGEKLMANQELLYVSPDAGAYKKVAKLMTDSDRILVGMKNRNPATGEITGTQVYCPVNPAGKAAIVVDDICDGGRTFIELGKSLRNRYAVDRLYLYVTHGIFSNGLGDLQRYYDHIFTTNSFPQKDSVETMRTLGVTVKEII